MLKKTLTILPLEEFIITPSAPEFHVQDRNFLPLMQKAIKRAKLSKKKFLEELILTEYEQQLTDSNIVDFIRNIQAKNAPLIVITPNVSGSFNKIPYLEVWTWAFLLKKNIDLSKGPLGKKQIIFNKMYSKIKGTYPTFYRGLLSCNSDGGENSSQNLLATLLAIYLKWLPDVVYVVHSKEDYIKFMEEQFKYLRTDIQVIGFIYAPEGRKFDEVTPKQFMSFWDKVIDKLNVVTRKESSKTKENPYEQ